MVIKKIEKTIDSQLLMTRTAEMKVKIIGLTPLICNSLRGRERPTTPTPEQEFQDSLYEKINGNHVFPAAGPKKAMSTAGGQINKKPFKYGNVNSCVWIKETFLVIEGDEPLRFPAWVTVKNAKIKRIRAMFENWKMKMTVGYYADVFTDPAQIVYLVNYAGRIGIGDWRPEKKGDHGRFVIDKK